MNRRMIVIPTDATSNGKVALGDLAGQIASVASFVGIQRCDDELCLLFDVEDEVLPEDEANARAAVAAHSPAMDDYETDFLALMGPTA